MKIKSDIGILGTATLGLHSSSKISFHSSFFLKPIFNSLYMEDPVIILKEIQVDKMTNNLSLSSINFLGVSGDMTFNSNFNTIITFPTVFV